MKTKELYVKIINMKMYLGLYFAAFVFFYGVLRVITGFEAITIIVLLEMAITSLVIAVLQVLMIPDNIDLSNHKFIQKSILWILLSLLIIFLTTYWGNWFAQMPTWSIYVFSVCATIGFLAMLIGLRFLQEADTIRLNQALQDYQEN